MARVDAVEREHWRERWEGERALRHRAGRWHRALQAAGAHRRVQALAPIVGIAGHDKRQRRIKALDELRQALHLPHPAGVAQAEVQHDGLDRTALPLHRHVQQAALLEAVIAHVVVADVTDRPARQQRVAVLALARGGVGAVGDVVAFGCQEFGLALGRPAE